MRWMLMLLLVSSLEAGDWSRSDSAREAVVMGALYVDWAQTREIQAHPERWEEMNGMIGHQPGQVNRYFLASALCHAGIAYLLPERERKVWQYVTIGLEAGCIGNNYSISVRVSF